MQIAFAHLLQFSFPFLTYCKNLKYLKSLNLFRHQILANSTTGKARPTGNAAKAIPSTIRVQSGSALIGQTLHSPCMEIWKSLALWSIRRTLDLRKTLKKWTVPKHSLACPKSVSSVMTFVRTSPNVSSFPRKIGTRSALSRRRSKSYYQTRFELTATTCRWTRIEFSSNPRQRWKSCVGWRAIWNIKLMKWKRLPRNANDWRSYADSIRCAPLPATTRAASWAG